MEDNQYLKMGAKYTKALARSMLHTKEIFGASIFNYAFDVNHLGGDKQPLLSAAHPLVGGGIASNMIAAADLSEAAVESILTMIHKSVDDRGIPIALNAKQVVIPAEEQFNAVRLFESTLRPGLQAGATGALNDVNAINHLGIFGKAPTIITRLSDPNAWFIKTDAPDSLKYFSRIAIANKMTDDWDTGDVKYGTRERYCFGWSDWRGTYGSPGST
jgi:hypothetical protein